MTTITADTIRIGDVIMPPARELSLWMRRTVRERGLAESALYLTVTEIREGQPDARGPWLVVKTQQAEAWGARLPFTFKARPSTTWPLIHRQPTGA